jgi:hypothetical protein
MMAKDQEAVVVETRRIVGMIAWMKPRHERSGLHIRRSKRKSKRRGVWEWQKGGCPNPPPSKV